MRLQRCFLHFYLIVIKRSHLQNRMRADVIELDGRVGMINTVTGVAMRRCCGVYVWLSDCLHSGLRPVNHFLVLLSALMVMVGRAHRD